MSVDGARGTDPVSGGQVPVDLDIAQHVLLGQGRALEGEAEAFAYDAVGAVAAQEVAGRQFLGPASGRREKGPDLVGVLLEGEEFGAASDVPSLLRRRSSSSRSVSYCGRAAKP